MAENIKFISTAPYQDLSDEEKQKARNNIGAGSNENIDSMFNEYLSPNRFAGAYSDGVSIEYSRDGGKTWKDYGASDIDKSRLFTTRTCAFRIGGPSSVGAYTSKGRLRITLKTGAANVYTVLERLHIYASTAFSQDCKITIKAAYEAEPDNYVKTIVEDMPFDAWPGWAMINLINECGAITTYGNDPNYQYGRIRFEFSAGELHDPTQTEYGFQVISIFGYGGVGWETPSNVALNGHVYTYDADMSVEFPNDVHSVNGFVGSGQYLSDLNANNITDGVLPIEYGGTGATTLEEIRKNINIENVPNVSTNNQTPTYTESSTLSELSSGETLSVAFGKIKKAVSNLISHIGNKSNPHSVTKSQVGLGNVDNTSDLNKPISTAVQSALSDINESQIGENLIKCPYAFASGRVTDGIKLQYGEDGVMHFSGTSGTSSMPFLCRVVYNVNEINLENDYYTLTIETNRFDKSLYMSYVLTNNMEDISNVKNLNINNSKMVLHIDNRQGQFKFLAYISLRQEYGLKNLNYDDVYIKISVEKGSISHEYQPYKLSRQSLRSDIDNKVDNDIFLAENLLKSKKISATSNNVSISTNDDGSYNLSGTSTTGNRVNFAIAENATYQSGKTYIVKDFGTFSAEQSQNLSIRLIKGANVLFEMKGQAEKTFTADERFVDATWYVTIANFHNCDNLTVKLMVEEGTVSHDYRPYKLSHYGLRDDIDRILSMLEK